LRSLIFCTTTPECLLVDVDHDLFDRLMPLAGWLRPSSAPRAGATPDSSKTFAAHGLDQDRELQFAAAGNFHRILVVGFRDAQRDIAFGFAQQASRIMRLVTLFAFGAGQR